MKCSSQTARQRAVAGGQLMFMDTSGHFHIPDGCTDLLAISHCETRGLCIRAMVPFAAGDVMDRFTGTISSDLTQHSLQVDETNHISDTRFIGFLSHGCEPNSQLDMERFELVALTDIAAGDVITIDYAHTEDVLYKQFPCACGAVACRGWIIGRKDDISEEGRRILGEPDADRDAQ